MNVHNMSDNSVLYNKEWPWSTSKANMAPTQYNSM